VYHSELSACLGCFIPLSYTHMQPMVLVYLPIKLGDF
jgi:hypothetical protein